MSTEEEIKAAARRLQSPTYVPAQNQAEKEAEQALEASKRAQYGADKGYYDAVGVLRIGREPYYDSNGVLHTPSTDPKTIRREQKELDNILKEEERLQRRKRW